MFIFHLFSLTVFDNIKIYAIIIVTIINKEYDTMSETKLRYSKQRETIYEVLKDDCTHPCVDDIYAKVKQLIPDISLGTVYRNLNLLADHHRITRLDIGDGVIHFDARIDPHYHLICDQCGTIQDIVCSQAILDELINKVNEQSEHVIEGAQILFHGTCSHCFKQKS